MRKKKMKIPFFLNTLHKKLNNTITYKKKNAQSSLFIGVYQDPNSQLGVLSLLNQKQAIDISNDLNKIRQLELNIRQEIIERYNHDRKENLKILEEIRAQTDAVLSEKRAEINAIRAETEAARAETDAVRAETDAVRAESRAETNAALARIYEINAENQRLRTKLNKKNRQGCCSIF